MKRVTAIITTHNRLELLKRAISSVLSQTYPEIELIVVDDHSDDGTKGYCSVQNFKYIHISQKESKGGNYARNLGIKNATGEYVAFCDDDDYWLPEKISKQVALIESAPNCEMVYCGRTIERIGDNGEPCEYFDKNPNPEFQGDMSKKILLTNCCCTTSTILATRHILNEVGLFDETLGFWQEYELTIRLAQITLFSFVDEPLSVYRTDKHDTHRLTNKYFTWRSAVKYIHEKHRVLYANLTKNEMLRVKNIIHRDAMNRCKTSGLFLRYHYHHLMSILCRVLKKTIK